MTQSKPKTEDCRHLGGYWINKACGQFRCYKCGFQLNIQDIPKVKGRKIESWGGGGR